jgi:hypothetical protein
MANVVRASPGSTRQERQALARAREQPEAPEVELHVLQQDVPEYLRQTAAPSAGRGPFRGARSSRSFARATRSSSQTAKPTLRARRASISLLEPRPRIAEHAAAYRVSSCAPSVAAVVGQWKRPPVPVAEPDAQAPLRRRLSIAEMHFLWSVARAKEEDEQREAERLRAAEEARMRAEEEARLLAIEQARLKAEAEALAAAEEAARVELARQEAELREMARRKADAEAKVAAEKAEAEAKAAAEKAAAEAKAAAEKAAAEKAAAEAKAEAEKAAAEAARLQAEEEAARAEAARLQTEADGLVRAQAEAQALEEALRVVSDSDVDAAVAHVLERLLTEAAVSAPADDWALPTVADREAERGTHSDAPSGDDEAEAAATGEETTAVVAVDVEATPRTPAARPLSARAQALQADIDAFPHFSPLQEEASVGSGLRAEASELSAMADFDALTARVEQLGGLGMDWEGEDGGGGAEGGGAEGDAEEEDELDDAMAALDAIAQRVGGAEEKEAAAAAVEVAEPQVAADGEEGDATMEAMRLAADEAVAEGVVHSSQPAEVAAELPPPQAEPSAGELPVKAASTTIPGISQSFDEYDGPWSIDHSVYAKRRVNAEGRQVGVTTCIPLSHVLVQADVANPLDVNRQRYERLSS